MRIEAMIRKNWIVSDYIGVIYIVIAGQLLPVTYHDYDGEHSPAQSYFQVGESRVFDLWFLDSKPILSRSKVFELAFYEGNTNISGKIIHFYNAYECRVDCGAITLDISCVDPIKLPLNAYIIAHGTLQAFVPDLDPYLSKEYMWPDPCRHITT